MVVWSSAAERTRKAAETTKIVAVTVSRHHDSMASNLSVHPDVTASSVLVTHCPRVFVSYINFAEIFMTKMTSPSHNIDAFLRLVFRY
jgi:hypothetical protein